MRELTLSLERPGRADFPYYGQVSGRRWLVVVLAVLAALATFFVVGHFLHGPFSVFVPTALFVGIPLAALAYATGGRVSGLFARLTWRDVRAMLGYGVLSILATIVAGYVVGPLVGTVPPNPIFDQIADAPPLWLATFYPRTALQLLGEELLTVLPFLALLHWLAARRGRTRAIVLAWVVSSVWFGLVHLPAYGWNVPMCVLVVGAARMALTWSYIRTKKLWVATGAHIAHDWLLLTPFVIAALYGAGHA
ncbi:hypothetical protein Ais01nite_62910 [Asanoa ishikariensis]|uniref:CAAX prenyl protease 2/Lysostaphin resistance protein A-like domain-containing protein n=1 Tax=Asanoa ishikariensis TaxID=137265 RepID=A0A1H3NY48_9ACTN|nr:CPBP family intramembrane glutamic endopeptidase [Asanoa ishikariensis]GIF68256.1 hypothetical protein Ais01nite_62910 [Asanoa ishikariensis]SDY93812.1 hypothetical protein SAMN05421684_2435 [Asanoa ishikariensis]